MYVCIYTYVCVYTPYLAGIHTAEDGDVEVNHYMGFMSAYINTYIYTHILPSRPEDADVEVSVCTFSYHYMILCTYMYILGYIYIYIYISFIYISFTSQN